MIRKATLKDFPDYLIYSDGSIIHKASSNNSSRVSEKRIKPSKTTNGYYLVTLKTYKGEPKSVYHHRLVWESFMGKIPNGMEIDHIDTNRKNNQLNNLQMVSHIDNCNNPNSLEKYKIANGIDKQKYDKERLLNARSKQYLEKVIETYYSILQKEGTVKVLTFMAEAHIGFYRAKRIIAEMIKNNSIN